MAVVHCLIHACNSGTKSSSSSSTAAATAAVATDATNCYEPSSAVVYTYSSSRAVLVYTTELQSDRSHSVVVDSDPGFEATNGFELLCSST